MNIYENYDLTSHNTFRMKVLCSRFMEYDSIDELKSIDFESLPQPVLHIGRGSNLLFTNDFPGTVLHSRLANIHFEEKDDDVVEACVGAGTLFDEFVKTTCDKGYWGAENLSFIPGEVGAAAVQNIGAYGCEVKDFISNVVCYDTKERCEKVFPVSDCEYAYRDSIFKHIPYKGRFIVMAVIFRLKKSYSPNLEYQGLAEALKSLTTPATVGSPATSASTGSPATSASTGSSATSATAGSPADASAHSPALTPMDVREAVIKLRQSKLPDPEEIGSAGSFFKNPVVSPEFFAKISPDSSAPHFILPNGDVKVPAAWMISQCGFKGASVGGAAVYDRQPLVIVNKSGDASARDVLDLEKLIINGVKQRFGVELHPEVEHI